MCLLLVKFFASGSTDPTGAARAVKSYRMLRILRGLRLIRLVKLPQHSRVNPIGNIYIYRERLNREDSIGNIHNTELHKVRKTNQTLLATNMHSHTIRNFTNVHVNTYMCTNKV